MLKDLLEAKPVIGRRVRINNDGQEREWLFPVEQLHVGDVLRVFPGERIPLDGVIVRGSSKLTNNVITRNSLIVAKNTGDAVACGVINCGSVIDVKVTAESYVSSLQLKIDRMQAKYEECSWWEKLLSCFSDTAGQGI